MGVKLRLFITVKIDDSLCANSIIEVLLDIRLNFVGILKLDGLR